MLIFVHQQIIFIQITYALTFVLPFLLSEKWQNGNYFNIFLPFICIFKYFAILLQHIFIILTQKLWEKEFCF